MFRYFGLLWRVLSLLPFLLHNPILHVTLHKRWGFLSCQTLWKENNRVIRIPSVSCWKSSIAATTWVLQMKLVPLLGYSPP